MIKHLNNEKIIVIKDVNILQEQTLEDLILLLRQKLKETYPQTKLKYMIKSIHLANGFSDKNLKRIAFILTDEIVQYLSNNQILNHDASVYYFNNKITSPDFVINQITLVSIMLENLRISKKDK